MLGLLSTIMSAEMKEFMHAMAKGILGFIIPLTTEHQSTPVTMPCSWPEEGLDSPEDMGVTPTMVLKQKLSFWKFLPSMVIIMGSLPMFSTIGLLCRGYHVARARLMYWTAKTHDTVKYATSGCVCSIGWVLPEVVPRAVTGSHLKSLESSSDADMNKMEQTVPESTLENAVLRNETEQVQQNHPILLNNVDCLAVVPYQPAMLPNASQTGNQNTDNGESSNQSNRLKASEQDVPVQSTLSDRKAAPLTDISDLPAEDSESSDTTKPFTAESVNSVESPKSPPAPSPSTPNSSALNSPALNPPALDPPTVDPSTADSSALNSSTLDPSVLDPPAVDPPALDPPALDPPAVDPPAVDPPAVDPPAVNSSALNSPALNPSALNSPALNPSAFNPPAVDISAVNQSALNSPAANSSAVNSPAHNSPSFNPPALNPPIVNPPIVNPPAAIPPAAIPPAANVPPATNVPTASIAAPSVQPVTSLPATSSGTTGAPQPVSGPNSRKNGIIGFNLSCESADVSQAPQTSSAAASSAREEDVEMKDEVQTALGPASQVPQAPQTSPAAASSARQEDIDMKDGLQITSGSTTHGTFSTSPAASSSSNGTEMPNGDDTDIDMPDDDDTDIDMPDGESNKCITPECRTDVWMFDVWNWEKDLPRTVQIGRKNFHPAHILTAGIRKVQPPRSSLASVRSYTRFPIASTPFSPARAAPHSSRHSKPVNLGHEKTRPNGIIATSLLNISTPTSAGQLPGLFATPSQSASNCATVFPSSVLSQSSSQTTAPESSAVAGSPHKIPSTDPAVGSSHSSSGHAASKLKCQDQVKSLISQPKSVKASKGKAVADKDSEDVIDFDSDDLYGISDEEAKPKTLVGPPRSLIKFADEEKKEREEKEAREEPAAAEEAEDEYEPFSDEDDEGRFDEMRTMPDGSERKWRNPKSRSKRALKHAPEPAVKTVPETAAQSAPKSAAKRNHDELVNNDFSVKIGGTARQIKTPATQSNKMPKLLSTPLPYAREE